MSKTVQISLSGAEEKAPKSSAAQGEELEVPAPRHALKRAFRAKVLESDADCVFNGMSIISPVFTPEQGSPTPSPPTPSPRPDVDALRAKLERAKAQEEEKVKEHASLVTRSLMEDLPQVYCESRARIPTTNGTEIFLHLYRNNMDSKEHLAIVFGQDIHSKTLFAQREGETEQDRMTRGAYVGKLYPGRQSSHIDESEPGTPVRRIPSNHDTLVRIHSECYTGETARSARCDCGEQLDEAARLMAEEGRGVIVYLRQEGRGIGLGEKLKAYNLQDLGADTVTANLMLRHPADARSFGLATAILVDLGLSNIRLLTNNPDKIAAVEGKDKQIKVTQRVAMVPLSWQNKGGFKSKEVNAYLKTKVQRMGHLLNLTEIEETRKSHVFEE